MAQAGGRGTGVCRRDAWRSGPRVWFRSRACSTAVGAAPRVTRAHKLGRAAEGRCMRKETRASRLVGAGAAALDGAESTSAGGREPGLGWAGVKDTAGRLEARSSAADGDGQAGASYGRGARYRSSPRTGPPHATFQRKNTLRTCAWPAASGSARGRAGEGGPLGRRNAHRGVGLDSNERLRAAVLPVYGWDAPERTSGWGSVAVNCSCAGDGERATGDKEFARPYSALGLHARWPIRIRKHTTATVKGARAVGRADMLGRAAGTTKGTRDDGGAHLMVRQCLCRDQGAMEAAHTLRRTPEQVGGEAACVDPCPAPRTRGRGQWAPQCWRNRGGRGLMAAVRARGETGWL
ncbi:hypothetical protein AcW1_009737 [Taiwanofungus camphoratus]|nr:hypothetical protein AcW1_009737 [Antrodia cinnamomea]